MQDFALLLAFIPTFFLISITPGMCMTLAMTLGMSIGVRRTMWMMLGELAGVALVAIAAVGSVATIMLNHPIIFQCLKYIGGAYLIWLGVNMWLAKGKAINIDDTSSVKIKRITLISQGFITAVSNPKGWIFMVSLLPKFIDDIQPLTMQMIGLLTIIICIEFCSMLIYASSGKTIRLLLNKKGGIKILNRISGSIMLMLGLWMALD